MASHGHDDPTSTTLPAMGDGPTPGQPPSLDPAPVAPIRPASSQGMLTLALIVIGLLAGGALFLAGFSVGRQVATTPGTPGGEQQAFQPFWDTYRAITDRYAGGSVDQKTIIEGAIKGMITALGDPYSSYLTSDEYRQSLQGLSGQFEGIGAEIATQSADGIGSSCSTLGKDCQLVIAAPIAGSPADKAGLKPRDVIRAIDGISVDGLSVDKATAKIRGPKGSTVILTVLRAGTTRDIDIVRDTIVQQEVSAKDLAGGQVGYLKVSGFSDNAAASFADLLAADVHKGERKIIVDLRGNPGGFVTASRAMASQFLASGPVYWQQDAQGTKTEVDALPGGVATDPSIEVVVLIDQGSASASEIVAGALQDRGRATLVGHQSFGKGTIQQWQPLENDTGGFKLTIARWLTPKQRWIHGIGLTPDVAYTAPAGTPVGTDAVLDKALQVLGAPTSADRLRPAA